MPRSPRSVLAAVAVLAAGVVAATSVADTVILRSGAVVQGSILKRTDQKVWVDLGPDVLVLDANQIERIDMSTPVEAGRTEQETLFNVVRDAPERSPASTPGTSARR